MSPGLVLGLVLALLCAVPAWPMPGDFNQDQRLDQEDLALLRAALGSADPLYDLNEDGRVDLEDFFRWADQIEIAPAAAPAPDSTAFPGSALSLSPVLPADTTALGPAIADSLLAEVVPADTTALLPSALPDSASLAPGLPDSVSTGVLPADTTALLPSALPDSASLAPGLPDSVSAGVLPADTTALSPSALPDSAGLPSPSPVRLPANMDPGRLSPALPLPVAADSVAPPAAAALPPDPIPSAPPDSADSTALPPAVPPLDSAAFVPPPFQPVSPAYYAVATTRQTTTVWFTGYTIVLRNTNPFGIASLRLRGQPVDFVHPSLPLGDWEWFWFSDPTWPLGQAKVKLIEQTWQAPEVVRSDTGVVLRFRRQNVLRRGVEVEVDYHLDARRPEFTVEYTIRNRSGQFLFSPYMMVGFPGFANQQWVEEVSTAEKVRRPLRPFADFRAEAQARKLADYLLLRQDWDPETQAPEALKGTVVLRGEDQGYTLTTTLATASGLKGGYIAHTNKPHYLTSHLYAFLKNMGEGESRSVVVHYVLSGGK